ncbi:MAG TPA: CBM35 domain-containing protein [Bacteroidota bacterium]|nr:CBM35 domain-containing protein [Bacteroidota bacterium]
MKRPGRLVLLFALLTISHLLYPQANRIGYNKQQLFLSGSNLAWVQFANDVGSSSPTDTVTFGNTFLTFHEHGGNAARWWLHTDGTVTPQFNDSGFVVGPGATTIADMKHVLDLAWQREVGVIICLWSFDMLRGSNSSTVIGRNKNLLLDTNYTRRYINSCLIPMVDSLHGHPAIIAWEIFNEPEGMASEFGFGGIQQVPMSAIQRVINLCAGAIHRVDTTALVTSGSWSFKALTDLPAPLPKTRMSGSQSLSTAEKSVIAEEFNRKYRLSMSTDDVMALLDRVSVLVNKNYYSDSQLLSAGGDPNGTLDFYSVHYYSTIDPSNATAISPFHHPASAWGLTKPIVVAEFATVSGAGNPPGIPTAKLYDTLYQLGYAGALPWSWSDNTFSLQSDILAGMQSMWNNHRPDVEVHGIAVDWPTVVITGPADNAKFVDTTLVPITVSVYDTLAVKSVRLYVSDTLMIGEVDTATSVSSDTSLYTYSWKNIRQNFYSLKAVVTNSAGHQRTSAVVHVTVGNPPMIRLEAEKATLAGSGVTIKSDATASGGKYVDVESNDTTARITWTIAKVPAAGTYPIAFGVKLAYQSPKSQYINVNGVTADTVVFQGSTSSWIETPATVNLLEGTNTIQMEMFWGWMEVDYLAVPSSFILTSVRSDNPVPLAYSLQQNFPNPFNPTTTIRFSLASASKVSLIVYNILGQKVATLVNGTLNAGEQSYVFDGSSLSSGVYYYRLTAGSYVKSAKMILLK